jgi:hypothetical protein
MVKIIIIILFTILSLGYLTLSIIFSLKSYKTNFENNQFLKEIENSINGKPIISLNFKSSCSPDEEILFFGEWDGAKEGYKCQNSINPYQCSLINITVGCTSIPSIYPIKYSKINSKYICIKRYNKTYRELLKSRQIISKNKECPLNYKSCGIIDTLERQLCFKNEEDCPITAEYFRNTNSNLIIKDKPFNTLNHSQILSLIKIHEYIPCMHPSEKNWHYNSILQDSRTCNTKILDKLLDNRYEEIPTMVTIKYYLYKDNEIDDKYNDYNLERVIVNLYGRSFMGFEGKKIDNYSYEDLLSYQTISNRCKTGMKYLFFITLGVIFIFAFYLFVNRGLGEYFHLFILYYIIVYLIYGIFYIIIFCYSLKIEKIFDIKESDKYSNEIIQLLIDTFSKNYYYSLSLIIVFGYMLLLTPISLVIFVPILRVRNSFPLL